MPAVSRSRAAAYALDELTTKQRLFSQLVPDWNPLWCSNEGRRSVLGRPRQFDLFKPGQQFAEEGAQLHPRERRSKAKMNPNSER
jgi:hypothetical protein